MSQSYKTSFKRDFVTELKPSVSYEPLMDKHLDFYFSRKKNRRILQANKIINRRNYIVDKSINKKLILG